MAKRYLCIVVLLLCAIGWAEEPSRGSDVISNAVRAYRTGDYDSTVIMIRTFLKDHGKDPAAEYLVPLAMEALARLGDYAPVNRLFELYNKKFRSSPFMPRVYYLHAYAQAKERSFLPAFESYSRALDGGISDDGDTLIMKSVETICAHVLDADALHDAGNNGDNHERIREIARYYEIVKLVSSGDIDAAKKRLGDFRNDYPVSRFDLQFPDLPSASVSKKDISIGLLVPLSGDDADVGKRVRQGTQLAVDMCNQRNQLHIKLTVLDTKGRLIETARTTQQLVDRDRVPVIIGPVLSPTATIAAGMVAGRDVVMITPTATDDGIASLGPMVFQMNITLGVLARKVARYALANLNIREFAIVAPRSAYGAALAAAFRDEVTSNGGSIFDEEYFDEGGNDFTLQFINLRRMLLLRKLNQVDPRPRTRVLPADSVKWADSSLSIGAIFMPAEAEDAVMLAPQAAFNRIKAQLLGSSGWHSPKTLLDGKQYVQNAIIATTFEPDSAWKKWPEFRKEYLSRFHEEPDRVAALGFDAGNIAMMALGNAGGTANRAKIAETIASLQKYEGASGIISFDRTNRTNSEAIILKLTPGGFVRVQ